MKTLPPFVRSFRTLALAAGLSLLTVTAQGVLVITEDTPGSLRGYFDVEATDDPITYEFINFPGVSGPDLSLQRFWSSGGPDDEGAYRHSWAAEFSLGLMIAYFSNSGANQNPDDFPGLGRSLNFGPGIGGFYPLPSGEPVSWWISNFQDTGGANGRFSGEFSLSRSVPDGCSSVILSLLAFGGLGVARRCLC